MTNESSKKNQAKTYLILLCILLLQSESHAEEVLNKLKAQSLPTLVANVSTHGNEARGVEIFFREKLGYVKCHERAEG